MPRFIGFLNPIRHQRGAKLPWRVLAITAIMVLLVGAFGPTWALAAEPDSEGEGTEPPGLENPHFEPGGEEAPLEVLPGGAESGSGAEEVEGPPIETESAQEPELPETAAEAAPPVALELEPPPPPGQASAPAAPAYQPAAPEYVAPAPTAAPVENEPIVAPSAPGPPPRAQAQPPQPAPEAAVPEAVAEAPPAVAPSGEQPAPPHEVPPPVPPATTGSGRVSPPLRGRSSYTVRPGDSLWSIAESVLPSGADNEEIAAEDELLWRLNEARIGTGDPNLILAGTVLVLR